MKIFFLQTWHHFLEFSISLKVVILAGIFIIVNLSPLLQSIQLHHQQQLLLNEGATQANQLQYQQKFFATLQQKNKEHALTPALTAKFSPINRQILLLAQELNITSSQWYFNHKPVFELQFQGYFSEIQLFITVLLQQFPDLQILTFSLNRLTDEQSPLEGEIKIQFNTVGN